MSGAEVVLVVAIGTLAGMDLVSWPQVMISRPLVASFLGGLAVGEPVAGLGLGALLELFALETLPVGASRYPDWGPGAVAAGALAGAGPQGTTPSGVLGIVVVAAIAAWLGGVMMHLIRRANGHAIHARLAALEGGDASAVRTVQWLGLARDAARSLVLVTLTLVAGDWLSTVFAAAWGAPQSVARVALAATSVGVALWAGWRLFGHVRQVRWFVGGLTAGVAMVVLWLS